MPKPGSHCFFLHCNVEQDSVINIFLKLDTFIEAIEGFSGYSYPFWHLSMNWLKFNLKFKTKSTVQKMAF